MSKHNEGDSEDEMSRDEERLFRPATSSNSRATGRHNSTTRSFMQRVEVRGTQAASAVSRLRLFWPILGIDLVLAIQNEVLRRGSKSEVRGFG
jgi:hypothetical protein